MRILIVEDDLVSRRFLQKFLSRFGECDVVVDGMEALDAFLYSLKENVPYSLICLDIMMPKVDGIKVLKTIRELETQKGIPVRDRSKVIMTTALNGTEMVQKAFELGCEGFASKPLDTEKLVEVMEKLGLI
ncbi:response regulator [Ruminiclostridium cellobioparum]|jgi:two-component system chemotaxis response regulator CheY|uniref:response regulator n=1 Tax=Ruminiclostridium cellobioparum TaxID=29355 RepID=UPI0028A97E06|nr:response regulator [Ruminiclostridium cellobioparum]